MSRATMIDIVTVLDRASTASRLLVAALLDRATDRFSDDALYRAGCRDQLLFRAQPRAERN